MAEREWTVMECEMGGDLVNRRCHVRPRCGVPYVCNIREHYCECESFVVRRVEASAATNQSRERG